MEVLDECMLSDRIGIAPCPVTNHAGLLIEKRRARNWLVQNPLNGE
jgi:hypothetical protein